MHTSPVPGEALDDWLDEFPSIIDNYGHLLLEQNGLDHDKLAEAFRSYFESAHRDAREYFHELIGIELHPDAGEVGAHATYPKCLPSTARRGLFGEVMAGMVTQHFTFVGKHKWHVPIFLFRYHADVEAYLFALARDASRTRTIFGRFGSDFIALALNENGEVVRYLAGEAKWRKSLSKSVVDALMLGDVEKDKHGNRSHSGKGIWHQVNLDTKIPHGIRQLQKLIKERDPNGWSAAIASIDKDILLKTAVPIPRTNLIFICGNGAAKRGSGEPLIEWEKKPAEYTSPWDLQVIELILSEGENLIDKIYDTLWDGK